MNAIKNTITTLLITSLALALSGCVTEYTAKIAPSAGQTIRQSEGRDVVSEQRQGISVSFSPELSSGYLLGRVTLSNGTKSNVQLSAASVSASVTVDTQYQKSAPTKLVSKSKSQLLDDYKRGQSISNLGRTAFGGVIRKSELDEQDKSADKIEAWLAALPPVISEDTVSQGESVSRVIVFGGANDIGAYTVEIVVGGQKFRFDFRVERRQQTQ